MAGRPPLPLGTAGKIQTVHDGPNGTWRARASYRGDDGVRKQMTRWGATEAAATLTLKKALAAVVDTATGDLTADTKVSDLAARWLLEVEKSDRAEGSKRLYRIAVSNYVTPNLGGLRLREAKVGRVDRALQKIRAEQGPGAAKTTRSVLSGMFGYAVRQEAIAVNPVRDTTPISVKRTEPVRALTIEQTEELVDALRSNQRAVDLDLPDLCEFMLGTAVRIGEACAALESSFHLDREARVGTFDVTGTVVRVKGVGLRIDRPKTVTSLRTLPLPGFVVDLVGRRYGEVRRRRPDLRVVFPSPNGYLRDPNNTSGDLRQVLDDLGWVKLTSHVFRKTAATRMDEAGMSARLVADHLGHAKPSMTQDVYMARKTASTAGAAALDR